MWSLKLYGSYAFQEGVPSSQPFTLLIELSVKLVYAVRSFVALLLNMSLVVSEYLEHTLSARSDLSFKLSLLGALSLL